MITFVTGLPGAGKGVYSVHRIIDVLRSTDKPIITNFAIELNPWLRRMGRRRSRGEKGFLAHLRDTYGETFGAENRIFVLDDEQMQHFYLHRVDFDGKPVFINAERDAAGKIVALDKAAFSQTKPCYYLVDEAWKFWNSRQWTKVESGFQFYNAQHRKAGDDLDITAQSASQIDKQMRVLVQEYHSLVNHRYRKLGVFKQPNMISVVITNEPPEQRSTLRPLPKVIRFTAEEKQGIGGSFDTAKGAGVQGNAADIEKKIKGMPWWGIFVLVGVAGATLWFGARALGWSTGQLLTGGFTKHKGDMENVTRTAVAAAGGQKNTQKVAPAVQNPPDRDSMSRKPDTIPIPLQSDDSPLAIVGWCDFGGVVKIMLNDGRSVTPGDFECPSADKKLGKAIVDGKVITWERQRPRSTQPHEPTYEQRPQTILPPITYGRFRNL